MLKEISLKNYRGFKKHHVPLKNDTVIVGKNNAGKSTLVEALRLVSIITARYQGLPYKSPPIWTGLPGTFRGVIPSLRLTEINLATITHRYKDSPGEISAKFNNGARIVVYVWREGIYAMLYDPDNQMIKSKKEANAMIFPRMETLPQVAPLSKRETKLNDQYVMGAMSSALAPLHFRNQIYLLKNSFFEKFKSYIAETWPRIRIRSFDIPETLETDEPFMLMIQEGDFSAEIGWMGHGIQIWMQMIWFITRTEQCSTIVLDEPDVYLHADLQRKLIRFLRKRKQQIIITTHSSEIISETDPENILIINRNNHRSDFATNLPALQRILEGMGSIHNLSLTRLWTSKKLLVIEEMDLKILKRLHDTLYPESENSLDSLPHMQITGWNDWDYAVGTEMFLKNAGGEGIMTYCLLDSDLHSSEAIQERHEEAKKKGVQLHIFKRKELENYLLDPAAIHRAICRDLKEKKSEDCIEEIRIKLDDLIDQYEEYAFINFSNDYSDNDIDQLEAERNAVISVKKAWNTREGKLGLVPGKRIIRELSQWSLEKWGTPLNPLQIAKHLKKKEIDEEIMEVLDAIEWTNEFSLQ